MRVVYLNRQNSHYSCKKFMFAKVENVVRVGLVGNFLCLCRNLEKKNSSTSLSRTCFKFKSNILTLD